MLLPWSIDVNIYLILAYRISKNFLKSFEIYYVYYLFLSSALCISFYVLWNVRLHFVCVREGGRERETGGGGLWDTNAVKESGSDKNLWASVALLLP